MVVSYQKDFHAINKRGVGGVRWLPFDSSAHGLEHDVAGRVEFDGAEQGLSAGVAEAASEEAWIAEGDDGGSGSWTSTDVG